MTPDPSDTNDHSTNTPNRQTSTHATIHGRDRRPRHGATNDPRPLYSDPHPLCSDLYSDPLDERVSTSAKSLGCERACTGLTDDVSGRGYIPLISLRRLSHTLLTGTETSSGLSPYMCRGLLAECDSRLPAKGFNMGVCYQTPVFWRSLRRRRPPSGTETRNLAAEIPGHPLPRVLDQNLKPQGVKGVLSSDPSDGYSVSFDTWTPCEPWGLVRATCSPCGGAGPLNYMSAPRVRGCS